MVMLIIIIVIIIIVIIMTSIISISIIYINSLTIPSTNIMSILNRVLETDMAHHICFFCVAQTASSALVYSPSLTIIVSVVAGCIRLIISVLYFFSVSLLMFLLLCLGSVSASRGGGDRRDRQRFRQCPTSL